MTWMLAALVFVLALSGCAATPVPGPSPLPAVRNGPLGETRRLAVVPSGASKFTVAGNKFDVGRVFTEVVKWYPQAAIIAPLAPAIQAGVDWLTEEGRAGAVAPHVRDVSPGTVIADAFARALVESGRFDQVRTLQREPVGDDRRQTDALVRLTVPAWGLVRIREGKPDLLAAYVDVRAQVMVRPTGAVVWEHDEDVTHAERIPLDTFRSDAALARQALMDVLERAGQRLASEYLYARTGGQ
jgi:hypothetical protein